MEKQYVGRGERVKVHEVPNVVAVKLSADHQTGDDIARLGEQTEVAADGSLAEEQRAFEHDGWVFVIPSDALREAIAARVLLPGTEIALRIFVATDDRLLLGLDRLTVRLDEALEDGPARGLLTGEGLEIVRQLTFAPNLFTVKVPPGQDLLRVAQALAQRPEVVYAEPVFVEHIPTRFTPVDPRFGEQWFLKNTGQGGGVPDADIHVEAAWDRARGAGVRIAIIDYGFELTHPDLETAVDLAVSGFFAAAPDPLDPHIVHDSTRMPNEPHGTFCAGIALARAENDEGGCGVANQADFIAIAALRDATTTQLTLGLAIAYATDPGPVDGAGPGADVISCSLGPLATPWLMEPVLQDAIDYAVTHGRGGRGTPIFWATQDAHVPVWQDQVCAYENTIAVGSSTRHDTVGDCAFGDELDFLATGVDVLSTHPPHDYDTLSGTSWAAPAAAGVAALLLELDASLHWQQIRQIMRQTCDQIGGDTVDYPNGHNPDYGFGRINAASALATLPV